MFGKLLGTAVRVVTLPVDAASATLYVVTGGDGSKESRHDDGINPFADIENIRDAVADSAESIDD